ncbi:MAG TPA: hypothetical protein VGR89_10560 [Puia sp.]|nr:hypothetical protein [Puia sp.]
MSFWLLLYLGIYFNVRFIPDSLMWKNNKPRTDLAGLIGVASIDALLFLLEAAALISLIYFVNKLFLRGGKGTDRITAKRTAKINAILSLCFIAILIWDIFKQQ